MIARAAYATVILGILLGVPSSGASASDYKYTGVRDCSRCHKKDLMGDQTAVWKKTAHATALETLKGEEAVKIAKERGITSPPHEADECVRCHATAYGVTPEQTDKRPLRLQDGVQCESCHGPGSEYKGNKVMSDREASLAAGMWDPGNDEKICLACHNDESPTFESFDYEKRKEEIAHPIPEHVKGHYLELEKEARRKAKGE
jgi:hypothetical protein